MLYSQTYPLEKIVSSFLILDEFMKCAVSTVVYITLHCFHTPTDEDLSFSSIQKETYLIGLINPFLPFKLIQKIFSQCYVTIYEASSRLITSLGVLCAGFGVFFWRGGGEGL